MTISFIQGDVREKLLELPSNFFNCIVTSPPYFGLRDYGTATWEGGDLTCDHVMPVSFKKSTLGASTGGRSEETHKRSVGAQATPYHHICRKCGARRIDVQIGIEPTLDAYLETMVAVCRELRRVLKPSGVMFLNIGDSYARAGGTTDNTAQTRDRELSHMNSAQRRMTSPPNGLKPKDLCLVPQRLGIALQEDGWWVRSHIIWHKPNPMPESVTDRPTSAHETIWMLTKSERYYWDTDAVAEASGQSKPCGPKNDASRNDSSSCGTVHGNGLTRNIRNVWTMATQPYAEAHFATFPPELAESCIKAACPSSGQVLDPFGGAGTTGLVADRLGCNATLIELNPKYADMARDRIKGDAPLFAEVAE